MNLAFLSFEDVLAIHRHQLKVYGGSDGIRDLGALQSALAMPESGFGEEYFHKNIHEMSAAYLFHLCQNHPFVDGNKRVALACCRRFLAMNGFSPDGDQDAWLELTMRCASGKADKAVIASFLKKHSAKARSK